MPMTFVSLQFVIVILDKERINISQQEFNWPIKHLQQISISKVEMINQDGKEESDIFSLDYFVFIMFWTFKKD